MARDGDARLAGLSCSPRKQTSPKQENCSFSLRKINCHSSTTSCKLKAFSAVLKWVAPSRCCASNDLVWSHAIHDYLLGEPAASFDLMAWNHDGTRLPARMHIEYLRGMFLNNDLAEGRFQVSGRPIEMGDIKLPIFVVGTENDHIAPWRSVFKLHQQNDGELTFVLTSGGHNAGIVSEPGHPHRHFRIAVRDAGGRTRGPDEWQRETQPRDGSWWVEWNAWLGRHSTEANHLPPPMGAPGVTTLGDAPGTYVSKNRQIAWMLSFPTSSKTRRLPS